MVYHPARKKYSEYQNKLRRVIGGQFVLKHENNIFKNNFKFLFLIKDLLAPFKFLIKSNYQDKLKNYSTFQKLNIFKVVLHNRYYSIYYKLKLIFFGSKDLTR